MYRELSGGGYSHLIFQKTIILARVTTCRTLPFGGRTYLGSVRML